MEVMMSTFPPVIFSLSLSLSFSLSSFRCPSVSLCAFSRSFIHLIIHSAKFAPSLLLSVVLQLTSFFGFPVSCYLHTPISHSLISWLLINFPSLLMGRNFCIVYHSSAFFCFVLNLSLPLHYMFIFFRLLCVSFFLSFAFLLLLSNQTTVLLLSSLLQCIIVINKKKPPRSTIAITNVLCWCHVSCSFFFFFTCQCLYKTCSQNKWIFFFFKSRGPRVSRNGKKVFESPPNVDDGFGDQS